MTVYKPLTQTIYKLKYFETMQVTNSYPKHP